MLPAGAMDISDEEEEEKVTSKNRRIKYGKKHDDEDSDEVFKCYFVIIYISILFRLI